MTIKIGERVRTADGPTMTVAGLHGRPDGG